MIGWINLAVLAACSLGGLVLYWRSVRPARLSLRIGPRRAYRRCTIYRVASAGLVTVTFANYVVWRFYPVGPGWAMHFPWPWWLSGLVAALLGLAGGWLMVRGILDAGAETMQPQVGRRLHGGIYRRVRHPQAVGGLSMWFVAAIALDSPFLLGWSLAFVPAWAGICLAEEADLRLRFGREYQRYAREVPMWIPRFGPGRGD